MADVRRIAATPIVRGVPVVAGAVARRVARGRRGRSRVPEVSVPVVPRGSRDPISSAHLSVHHRQCR